VSARSLIFGYSLFSVPLNHLPVNYSEYLGIASVKYYLQAVVIQSALLLAIICFKPQPIQALLICRAALLTAADHAAITLGW
jgi:hypothetical protein